MTRIPLSTDLKTRTLAPDKDARLKNCYIEGKGDPQSQDYQTMVRKRPSANNAIPVGTGIAQGGLVSGGNVVTFNGDVLNISSSTNTTLPSTPYAGQSVTLIPQYGYSITVNGGQIGHAPPTIPAWGGTSVIIQDMSVFTYFGLCTKWTASGSCTVPSRTTAINPYNQTTGHAHIPNTGLDLTSQASTAFITQLLNGSVTYSDEAFQGIPSSVDLGWTLPGSAGGADANLTEFISTQQAEWTNYSTIQTATIAALNAAGSATVGSGAGNTPYYTTADAQAVIDALVAAGGGTGNSYHTDTAAGSVLSGSGTVTGPTYIDVGTLHATMSMSKAFSGGYNVIRRVTRTYSIRSVSTPNVYDLKYISSTTNMYNVYTIGLARLNALTDSFDGSYYHVYSLVSYDAARDRFMAKFPTPDFPRGGLYTYENPHAAVAGNSRINWDYYASGVFKSSTSEGPDMVRSAQVTRNIYYVDYTDVATLVLTANAGLSANSAMSASQQCLQYWTY